MRTSGTGLLNELVEEIWRKAVWSKGREIFGLDPGLWRADHFDSWMFYPDHGDRNSQFGWEIDHVFPSALGGSDTIDNLRPLHWRNNSSLGGILGGWDR
jgi:hypothetical protein